MQLYKSGHFLLSEIRTSGKKGVAGVLCFKGLPSPLGSKSEVLAIEDGVVLRAGRCSDLGSREHRIGTYVCVSGKNGVSVLYGRLACRFVRAGDYVSAGDSIGIEGSSGSGRGDFLTLEFRRNGRRVDGCDYLGIPHETNEFLPEDLDPSEIVSKSYQLDDATKEYINGAPNSDELWKKLMRRIDDTDAPNGRMIGFNNRKK
ncbi:MAG: M23 family metallopeptidase [Clostridiales bacterium]|nr:M23 family metallopeptidase [Clostridiales bacterium]